jgi:hypothetical protein
MRQLITLHLEPPDNTLEHVLSLPGLGGLAIDRDYGLVAISPKRGLYVIRVSGPIDREAIMPLPEVRGIHGDVGVAPIAPGKTTPKTTPED